MSLQNRLNAKRSEIEQQQHELEQQEREAAKRAAEEAERIRVEIERIQQEEELRKAEETTTKLREEIEHLTRKKEQIESVVQNIQNLSEQLTENKEVEYTSTQLLKILADPENKHVLQAMGISDFSQLISYPEFQEDQEIKDYHNAVKNQQETEKKLQEAQTHLQEVIEEKGDSNEEELLTQAHTYLQRLEENIQTLSEELPEVKKAKLEQERAEQIAYLKKHFTYQEDYYKNSSTNNFIKSTREALQDPHVQGYPDVLLTEYLQKLMSTTLNPTGDLEAIHKDLQTIKNNEAIDTSEAVATFNDAYKKTLRTLEDLLESSPTLKEKLEGHTPQEILFIGITNDYYSLKGNSLQTIVLEEQAKLDASKDRAVFITKLQEITEQLERWMTTIKNESTSIPEEQNPFYADTWFSDLVRNFNNQKDFNLTQPISLSTASSKLLRSNNATATDLPRLFEKTYGQKYQELSKLKEQAPKIVQLSRIQQQKEQLQEEHKDDLEKQKASESFEPIRKELEIGIQSCKASTDLHLRQETTITLTEARGWASQSFTLDHPKLQRLQTLYRTNNTTKNELQTKEITIQNLQRQLARLGLFNVIEKARLQRTLQEEEASLQDLKNTAEEQKKVIQQFEQETKEIQELNKTLFPIVDKLTTMPPRLKTGIFANQSEQSMQLGDFLQYAEEAVQQQTVEHQEAVVTYEKLTKQEEELRTELAN